MTNKEKQSRRNFLKVGLLATGTSFLGNSSVYCKELESNTLLTIEQIPLNNILKDFYPHDKVYGYGLTQKGINNKESWDDKRKSILRRAKIIIGEAPSDNLDMMEPVVLKEIQCNGYKESKIQFPSGTGDLIKGYLLVPNNATISSPKPAIMALHSTGPGASQVVGNTSNENRSYGKELAQRGYVVLALDVISAGERIYPGYKPYYTNEFYKEFPLWSAMGKMIHDHKRGIDYLCRMEFVDSNNLGCIGHSLGGYNSFFLQAFDDRIKAAVSSCGISPMGRSNAPYQFAREDWFVHFNPICRDYIRAGMIPCDMHEIMSLCAPRPLFNYSAKQDSVYFHSSAGNADWNFDKWWQTVDNALDQIAKVYELHGKAGNFVRSESDGDHDFPDEIREAAYKWLDKHLKRD